MVHMWKKASFTFARFVPVYKTTWPEIAEESEHITRVGTLIVATIYLQLIQNRCMFRSFTVLQCSHQDCL